MAIIIEEPNDVNPATIDWQKILSRTTFQGGGFMQLKISNLNNQNEPVILRGSRLEVNSSFYICEDDEIINNDISTEQWIYVYAIPQINSLLFEYSNIKPVFDTVKNGWYNENNRAIATMYKRTDGWWSKILIETYENMFDVNFTATPTTGGATVLNLNTTTGASQISYYAVTIKKGAYWGAVKGGKGGYGGQGYGNSIGATPATPATVTFKYNVEELEETFMAKQGQGGGDGDSGGLSQQGNFKGAGGGGSGARGGSSFIWFARKIFVSRGTNGTAGTNATGGRVNGAGAAAPSTQASVLLFTYYMQIETNANGSKGSDGVDGAYTGIGGAAGTTKNANNGYVQLYQLWKCHERSEFVIQ